MIERLENVFYIVLGAFAFIIVGAGVVIPFIIGLVILLRWFILAVILIAWAVGWL